VDPVTGALINVAEHQTMSLRNPSAGAQALLLFDANLKVTPASLTTIVKLDTDGRSKLSLLKVVLPLVLGIVGVIALVTGLILGRRRRPRMEDELTEMSREYATAPVSEAAEEKPDPGQA
jgi:Porin PorA